MRPLIHYLQIGRINVSCIVNQRYLYQWNTPLFAYTSIRANRLSMHFRIHPEHLDQPYIKGQSILHVYISCAHNDTCIFSGLKA